MNLQQFVYFADELKCIVKISNNLLLTYSKMVIIIIMSCHSSMFILLATIFLEYRTACFYCNIIRNCYYAMDGKCNLMPLYRIKQI